MQTTLRAMSSQFMPMNLRDDILAADLKKLFASADVKVLAKAANNLLNIVTQSRLTSSYFDSDLLNSINQLIYIDEPSVYVPVLESLKIILSKPDHDVKYSFCQAEGIDTLIWHIETRLKISDYFHRLTDQKKLEMLSNEDVVYIFNQIAIDNDMRHNLVTTNALTYTTKLILNPVVIEFHEDIQFPRSILTIPLVKHTLFLLRTMSYSSDPKIRIHMRNCPTLVASLASLAHDLYNTEDYNSKILELSISVLRNLSYSLPEEFDPSYNIRMNQRIVEDTIRSKKKRKDTSASDKSNKFFDIKSFESNPVSIFWSEELLSTVFNLTKKSSSPIILEASAGIIQNICSYNWLPADILRKQIIETQSLCELYPMLCSGINDVVHTTARCLRNLCLGPDCKDLIAKEGMQWIISGLHRSLYTTEEFTLKSTVNSSSLFYEEPKSSAKTDAALLALAYSICKDNLGYSKIFVDLGGVSKCNAILRESAPDSKSDDGKCNSFCRDLLSMLWKQTKLHSTYKNIGLTESDFNGKLRKVDQKEGSKSEITNKSLQSEKSQSKSSTLKSKAKKKN